MDSTFLGHQDINRYVPQGSCFGSFEILTYINNVPFLQKGIVTSYADNAFSCYTKKSQESPISNKLYPIEPGKIATYKKMSLNSVKMKCRAIGSALNSCMIDNHPEK